MSRRYLNRPARLSDPRDVIPELKRMLSDEDVAAWQACPRCLCGCGKEVKIERKARQRTPIDTYRFFTPGHETRMPWVRKRQRDFQEERRNASRARADECADECIENAVFLSAMIWEWQQDKRRTSADLAAISGLSERLIGSVKYGQEPQVRKLTAARLLVAMGETRLRPELAKVYRAWAESRGISHERIKG